MKIAFFTDSYNTRKNYNDGVAVISQKFAHYAVKKKLFLRIFTNDIEDRTEEISETVKVYHFKPNMPWYLPKYNEVLMDFVVPNPKLIEIFDKDQFDVIHFTQPSIMGANALYVSGRPLLKFPLTVPCLAASIDLPILRTKRDYEIPLVGSFHTDIPAFMHSRTGYKFFRNRGEEMVNHFYKNCDIILATSYTTMNEITQYIDGKSYGIFRSGVDINAFNPGKRDNDFRKRINEKIILLFAGRLTPEKNIQFLIDAFLELRQKHENIHLFIAGDGELRETIKQKLGNDVTAPGFLFGEDLYKAFASSDIFVFPSITDTLGLVVLEAQASGLPVVVMDQGGPKEVMENNNTGFLCKANVMDDFIKKISLLIENHELRIRMGKNARIFSEKYSWDSAFTDLIKVYEKVVYND